MANDWYKFREIVVENDSEWKEGSYNTNLVAEVNDLVFLDDHMRVGYFRRTGLLIYYTKSDADNDIKSQGVITAIVIPDYT